MVFQTQTRIFTILLKRSVRLNNHDIRPNPQFKLGFNTNENEGFYKVISKIGIYEFHFVIS